MAKRPRLAEVNCTRLAFEPGDRVLVRTYHPLSDDERRKLQRAVQRWAGTDIEVLIIDAMQMEVWHEKRQLP